MVIKIKLKLSWLNQSHRILLTFNQRRKIALKAHQTISLNNETFFSILILAEFKQEIVLTKQQEHKTQKVLLKRFLFKIKMEVF